jgi:hypothetical protein
VDVFVLEFRRIGFLERHDQSSSSHSIDHVSIDMFVARCGANVGRVHLFFFPDT